MDHLYSACSTTLSLGFFLFLSQELLAAKRRFEKIWAVGSLVGMLLPEYSDRMGGFGPPTIN